MLTHENNDNNNRKTAIARRVCPSTIIIMTAIPRGPATQYVIGTSPRLACKVKQLTRTQLAG